MGKFVDLTGAKYGKLTVVEKSNIKRIRPKSSDIQWVCKCDCGNEETILKTTSELKNLKNGGCSKCSSLLVDLTGKTFGTLTVLRRGEDKINPGGTKDRRWICYCSCDPDKEIIAYGKKLTAGITTCCKECLLLRRSEENKTENKYEFLDNYVIGYTYDNQQFYIDKDDYEKIKNMKWYVGNKGYIMSTVKGKNILLHRLIMDVLDDNSVVVDHIGHDLFDNRKSQLRICTSQENSFNTSIPKNNTSGVKGVYYHKINHKWIAYIEKDGKRHSLGSYINFNDAINARKKAEEKFFGKYSYDNSMNIKK